MFMSCEFEDKCWTKDDDELMNLGVMNDGDPFFH